MIQRASVKLLLQAFVAAILFGCGGGGSTTIGGTLSGLPTGTAVIVQNGGKETLTLAGNGSFTFSNEVSSNERYDVTIVTQPAGATCSIANGSGTIDNNASMVTDIAVVCVANRTVSITVSGLNPGTSVTLTNNGIDALAVATNGTATFSTALPQGATYNVVVSVQPVGQACTVAQGNGTIAAANVTSVVVTCV